MVRMGIVLFLIETIMVSMGVSLLVMCWVYLWEVVWWIGTNKTTTSTTQNILH